MSSFFHNIIKHTCLVQHIQNRLVRTSISKTHAFHGLKTMVIFLRAFVWYRLREIGDGVIHQKTVLLKWNASYVISQFSQSLGIPGEGKLAHAHLDGKFLDIVLSFDHTSLGGQTAHHDDILEDGTSCHKNNNNNDCLLKTHCSKIHNKAELLSYIK